MKKLLLRLKNKLLLPMLFLLLMAVSFNGSAQTLVPDQTDYAPGTLATITGDGFTLGEAIYIHVDHFFDGIGHEDEDYILEASENTKDPFFFYYNVGLDEAFDEFIVTARQDNGKVASCSFTDTPPTATKTVLSSSSQVSDIGEAVIFTATVTYGDPSVNVNCGNIKFKDVTGPAIAEVHVINGIATLSISSLSIGVHTITAEYKQDNSSNCNYSASSDSKPLEVIGCNPPVITNPGDQTACDSYTLPTINGSNITANAAYYDNIQANAGAVITGPITSSQKVWIYDATAFGCSDEESFDVTIEYTPVITNPGAKTACDSYTLPAILGTNLTGNQKYYDNSQANAGAVITGPITSSQKVWIYDATAFGCSDEESFDVTIEYTPVITNPGAKTACDSYTLPTILGTNLTGNQKYYDNSQPNAGAVITGPITSSQKVWIYDATAFGCSDEESFDVTIEYTPVITNPGAKTACDSYTLPTILGTNLTGNQKYYDNSQPNAGAVITGPITSSQKVWIYDATAFGCSDEESFDVTIEYTPVITNPGAKTACDSYTLPTILGTNLTGNQKYYDNSQANAGAVITGPITSSQKVWIYDATAFGCSDEESFDVTIEYTPVITNPGAKTACDSYTLPTILGTNLTGNQKYYDNSQANAGAVITGPITSSQKVWIYDATAFGCSDEESFDVIVNYSPAVTTNPIDAAICAGDPVTFTAAATGTPAPTVQWQVSTNGGTSWAEVPGATSTTLTFNTVATQDGYQYQAVFTNTCNNATTTAATLTVKQKPQITTQPQTQAVCEKSSLTLTVAADTRKSGTLSYQWYHGSTPIGNNSANLNINPIGMSDAGSYTVKVTNDCGDVTSSAAVITVRPATDITKITIDNEEIISTSFNYGCKTPQLRVYATGYQTWADPLRYQWYLNGSAISGAILPIYNVPSGTSVGTYVYKVVVSGACYFDEASVTVKINQQPADADLDADSYYTGPNIAWTPTPTSNTATVTLAAFLKNSTAEGAECGDISTARVTFLVNGSRIPSATNLPVSYVDPTNPSKGGTAAAIVQLNISNSTASSEIFDIKVEISGNYKAGEAGKQLSQILVGKLQPGGAIGGGAKLLNLNSTGYVKGNPLMRTTATFGVEYSTKGKSVSSPKGRVTLMIPSFNDKNGNPDSKLHWYFVKSNAIATLAITSPTAIFTAKCNISEYDPNMDALTAIEGNCVITLDMGDYSNKCPNLLDKVGVTVQRNAGGIWYSNNWVNTKTVMTNIFGGDLSVTGASVITDMTKAAFIIPEVTPEVSVEPTLCAYPNPFTERLNIEFSSATDTQAIMEIYSITGAKLETLFNGPVEGGVLYKVEYIPNLVSSQMVFYHLTMNGKTQVGKVIYNERR